MPGWLLITLQIIFVAMAFVMLADYRRRGVPSLLFGVIGYSGSAFASYMTGSGWPLLIGLVAMMALKRIGYDLG